MKLLLAGLFLSSLIGCQRVVVPGPLPVHAGEDVQRDAGYALLVNLLDQEARLDGLLEIKSLPSETVAIIQAIATDASEGARALKATADEPPPMDWSSEGLPTTEIQARNFIAGRTSLRLLSTSGSECELELVLSQLTATEYIIALTAALTDQAVSVSRRTILKGIGSSFHAHHEALRARLRVVCDGT
jgi:hypothetical protein